MKREVFNQAIKIVEQLKNTTYQFEEGAKVCDGRYYLANNYYDLVEDYAVDFFTDYLDEHPEVKEVNNEVITEAYDDLLYHVQGGNNMYIVDDEEIIKLVCICSDTVKELMYDPEDYLAFLHDDFDFEEVDGVVRRWVLDKMIPILPKILREKLR